MTDYTNCPNCKVTGWKYCILCESYPANLVPVSLAVEFTLRKMSMSKVDLAEWVSTLIDMRKRHANA